MIKIILFSAAGLFLMTTTSCTKCSKNTDESKVKTVQGVPVIDTSGLKTETLKPGAGAVAEKGKNITIHYVGKLEDGKEFDSSHKRKLPLTIVLGSGQIVVGWDKGMEGMRVGEVRRIKVPSALAYGSKGVGSVIPPDANLVYEVELLRVE